MGVNAYFAIFVVDLYVTGRRGVVMRRHNADDLIWMVFRVCSRTVAKRPGTASPNKKADRLSGCELVRQRGCLEAGRIRVSLFQELRGWKSKLLTGYPSTLFSHGGASVFGFFHIPRHQKGKKV